MVERNVEVEVGVVKEGGKWGEGFKSCRSRSRRGNSLEIPATRCNDFNFNQASSDLSPIKNDCLLY
jgi:hypothetical protein